MIVSICREGNMQSVCQFIKECGVYYLSTVSGDKPKVRPFGTIHIFEDKLYVQMGKSKDVFKQLSVNPNAEICACKGSEWLRLSGKLVYDDNREARKSMLDAYPQLRSMYNEDDGNTAVLYFEDATATFYSFTAAPRIVRF